MRSLLLFVLVILHPARALLSFGEDVGWISFLFSGCWLAAFPALQFFLFGYRYKDLVSDNGAMQLSQAGIYVGPEAIQEYGSFLTETSLFLAASENDDFKIQYMGRQGDGQCVFDVGITWYHLHDAATSAFAAEYEYPIMFKALFPRGKKASRVNVYFAPGFFEQVFTRILDSSKTRQTVCDIYENQCASLLAETSVECLTAVNNLPVSEGANNWIDGNSQGCRALHGAFATFNPETHCPHLSFSGQADVNGEIKCQNSLGITPEELFDDSDFAFWNEYCNDRGFDPEVGFREIL